MAKKKAMSKAGPTCGNHKWFSWLILLLGLWFLLGDFGVLATGNWNFWHLLLTLVGIKLVAKGSCC